MDFTKDSNNFKVANIIHHNFKELYNCLEAIRNSYYFLNHEHGSKLKLECPLVVNGVENNIILETDEIDADEEVVFYSELLGELGTSKTVPDIGKSEFNEHINIIHETEQYQVVIYGDDLKSVKIVDSNGNVIENVNFDFRTHTSKYETVLTDITVDYKVVVETWSEYTYISYSNGINSDLDIIGALVGCKRRGLLQ